MRNSTCVFDKIYQNDETGRPAYDPAILLKIVLFAYSKGITTSHEIQWCCETNIIFKALSCDTVPHFTSIANFVSRYPAQIEAVFEQILLVCDEQGLLGKELFAIDGCKMSSDASKEWSGTFKELSAKRTKPRQQIRYHLDEQHRLDQQDCHDEASRQRHQQTAKTLSEAADKIDRFLKTQSPRMGQGRLPSEVKSNITDNDSAKMKTSKGTIQGYTGVATVDKIQQVIVDAQVFGAGRQMSFQLNEKRRATYTDWMRHRIDSRYGKQIYAHRMSTVEPVFGNMGTTKRLNRFSLRGQQKVQGQWQLYYMVDNIEKIKNDGQLVA